MKLFIKNKVFSVGDGSKVLDENQNPVYRVKVKEFSITRKKFIYDMQGNLLFTIRNKWFNWFVHKAYIYDANKNKIATAKDKFFNVNKECFVQDCKGEIKLDGKILFAYL